MHKPLRFFFLLLILGLVPSLAQTASVTLAWTASVSPGVAGYRLHYGAVPGTYTATQDAGSQTMGSLGSLVPGQRYFIAVSAYDGAGMASPFSNEVEHTVPLAPSPVTAATQLRVVPRP